MKLICKHCGEEFTAAHDDVKLLENGFIGEITPVCDECFELTSDFKNYGDNEFTDADSGL